MQLSTRRSTKSFADMLCNIMVLCRGHLDSGQPFWAYLCMLPTQARMFHEARAAGTLDLEDFGTVLEWGEGNEPPLDIRHRMKRDFGMREDYEDLLLKAIAAQG